MKIAVNTRLLLHGRLEGIGWFAHETLSRITRQHPEHEFLFIFDRKPHASFIYGPNVKAVVAHPQARHPLLWYLFFEYGVAAALRRYRPDVFLSPDGWLSLRSAVPSVAVIHDLNFEAHPEWVPGHIAWYYHRFFPKFAAKAARIATVSEFTRSDLHKRYGIPRERVDVVYNGAGDAFRPFNAGEAAKVKNTWTDGEDYFLFVGLIHPRKNLENQLKAYYKFRQQHGTRMKFVVVGARHWWSKELEQLTTAGPFARDVVFLGRQQTDVLAQLYGAAFALIYTSLYEGFGIPLLEAMHAGIPIITSSVTSMPEIAGKAAIIADPRNADAIADAMGALYTDKDLRKRLVEAGTQRMQDFSWDITAEKLWVCIQKAVRNT